MKTFFIILASALSISFTDALLSAKTLPPAPALAPASVNITLTIDSADLAILMPELCAWASLPQSNANAKQALIIFVKQVHTDAQKRANAATIEQQSSTIVIN